MAAIGADPVAVMRRIVADAAMTVRGTECDRGQKKRGDAAEQIPHARLAFQVKRETTNATSIAPSNTQPAKASGYIALVMLAPNPVTRGFCDYDVTDAENPHWKSIL